MPWSGSAPNKTFSRNTGVYTGTTAWQQTDAAARGIRADDHDVHDEDLATGINTALAKDGGNKPTADIDWGAYGITNLGELSSATEASVASATTTNVLGQDSLFVSVTGTTTITSLGTGAKTLKFVRFTGALTLTHNATSLILPGGTNITTAAGDTMIVVSDASSNARVMNYERAVVAPLAAQPGMALLTSGTVSAATNLAISLASYTQYRSIKIVLNSFRPATDNATLAIFLSADGGSTYLTGSLSYCNIGAVISVGTESGGAGSSANGWVLTDGGVGNLATEGVSLEITLADLFNSAIWARGWWNGVYVSPTPNPNMTRGAGAVHAAGIVNAVKFAFSSGNITSGTYAVYGLL